MTAKIKETAMRLVFALAAVLSVLAVIFICIFLFAGGAPAFRQIGVLPFLTGQNWRPLQNEFGIFPMIIGSIYVTAGAIVVGVPLGIGTAVFLARFCPAPLYRVLKPAVNLLAGIPSIVYGFFGLTVLVPAVQALFGTSGKGVLTASLVLGIMILPTIINVSESALRAVPNSYYEGALALGATKERAVLGTLLPAAKSGVSAGVILGIGRAIGEAMAVSMVAGNQPIIPKSLTDGVRTLTANIVLEMAYAADLHRQALIATGVVLFVFILIINRLVPPIRLTTETLAGIPSIVYGLFGYLVFVKALHLRLSLLSGALTLAIMILPTIMRTTEEALRSIPQSYREASFGLGAGRLRTVFVILLPTALPGILGGVLLSVGRIVGETAALIYTAGTVAKIAGLTDGGRTLAVHMYALIGEGLYTDAAYATAVVLLAVVILLNALSDLLLGKHKKGDSQ